MGASSLEKKQNLNKHICATTVEQVAEYTAQYFHDWATRELVKFILLSKDPVCLINGHDLIVGKFKIQHKNSHWQVQHVMECTKPLSFDQKQSAVMYSICYSSGYLTLANDILSINDHIVKLQSDLAFYQNSLSQSLKKPDSFRSEVMRSRISDSRIQLKQCVRQLQKNIMHAKYLKVWSPDQSLKNK
jgi:hypothetical protein